MVNAVEGGRVTTVGDAVKLDITGTYVLPYNWVRKFIREGVLELDSDNFIKTLQGEAFLAVPDDGDFDIVLVNRVANNQLNLRGIRGFRQYNLYVNGELIGIIGDTETNWDYDEMQIIKETICKTLKIHSLKFGPTYAERERYSSLVI